MIDHRHDGSVCAAILHEPGHCISHRITNKKIALGVTEPMMAMTHVRRQFLGACKVGCRNEGSRSLRLYLGRSVRLCLANGQHILSCLSPHVPRLTYHDR